MKFRENLDYIRGWCTNNFIYRVVLRSLEGWKSDKNYKQMTLELEFSQAFF